MDDFWSMICGDNDCSKNEEKSLCYDLKLLKDPSSCINHVLVLFFHVLVLIMLLFIMILKSSLRPYWSQVRYSNIQLVSAITNGFFNKIWFWWLNPLMKTSQEKTLQDEDIPNLRESDRAEICYVSFIEQLNNERQCEASYQSSVLWTIVSCHRREILVTGFFALLKVGGSRIRFCRSGKANSIEMVLVDAEGLILVLYFISRTKVEPPIYYLPNKPLDEDAG